MTKILDNVDKEEEQRQKEGKGIGRRKPIMIRQGTLRAQFNSDLMEKLRNLNEYRSKKILD